MTKTQTADRIWAIARPLGWLLVAATLIAPAAAMRFTDEVRWTALDFGFAAALLIGGGLICELFAWRVRNGWARVVFSLIVVLLVALVWGASIN